MYIYIYIKCRVTLYHYIITYVRNKNAKILKISLKR